VIEASPVRSFPSEAIAIPENGTRAGITVGAEAAAGVRGDIGVCPDAAAKDAVAVRAKINLQTFIISSIYRTTSYPCCVCTR
jgi:hypothetical protein